MQSRHALLLALVAVLMGPVASVACQGSPAPNGTDHEGEDDDDDVGGGPAGAGGQSAGGKGGGGGGMAPSGGSTAGAEGGDAGGGAGGAGGTAGAGGSAGVVAGAGGETGGGAGGSAGADGSVQDPAGTFDRSRALRTYLSWAEVDAIRAKVAAKAEPWAAAAAQVIAAANTEAQSTAIYTVTANGGHNGDRNGFYSYRP